MPNIIFDLDGTLLESRLRLYNLFQALVTVSELSYESYWAFKRNGLSNEKILTKEFGYDAESIDRFTGAWMEQVEAPEYLSLDTSIIGLQSALRSLPEYFNLHVCTARQHPDRVMMQLENLGLLNYFDSVMVTEQRRSKRELVAALPRLGAQDWIVGDAGEDIQVGRDVGINTCAVLSGFLSEKRLRAYNPKLVKPTVVDFCEYVLASSGRG